jgi:hypothetical protein
MGDDVRSRCRSFIKGIAYICAIKECGHELQSSKQLIGNFKSEFLRETYSTDGIQGNLNRSISSFVSSDLQAPEVTETVDFVKGTNEAIHTLIRRGFSKKNAEKLRTTILHHFCRDRQTGLRLNDERWLYTNEKTGGFGCSRFGVQPYMTHNTVNYKESHDIEIDIKRKEISGRLLGTGLQHLTSVLSKQLHARDIPVEYGLTVSNKIKDLLSEEVMRSTDPSLFKKLRNVEMREKLHSCNKSTFMLDVKYDDILSDHIKNDLPIWNCNVLKTCYEAARAKDMIYVDIEDIYNIIASTILGDAGTLDHSLMARIFNDNDIQINNIMSLIGASDYMESGYKYNFMLQMLANSNIITALVKNNLHEDNNTCGVMPSIVTGVNKYIKSLVMSQMRNTLKSVHYTSEHHYALTRCIMSEEIKLFLRDESINMIRT